MRDEKASLGEDEKRTQLLGICGVYCGACPTYRAYNDNDQALYEWEIENGMPPDEIICKGCGSHVLNKWCSNCDFRKCVKEKGIDYCFECKDFPCKKIVDFSKTKPHRTLGLRNLEKLRETKIEEWLSQQEKRWSCNECGNLLHWYSERCPTCGAEFRTATQEASL